MWPYGALWLLLGLLALLLEGSALLGAWKRGGTLSQIVWSWAGVPGNRWTWKRLALFVFLGWLLLHLAFGWLSL
jgi:hypothetical protein